MTLNHLHMHQGTSLLSSCRATSTVIHLLPKTTFTPSIQPHLGLPRTRPPLLPPSTPIQPFGAQTTFQYSLIRSTRELPFYTSSSTHHFIPNSIHSVVTLQPNFSNTSYQEHLFSSSQHLVQLKYGLTEVYSPILLEPASTRCRVIVL